MLFGAKKTKALFSTSVQLYATAIHAARGDHRVMDHWFPMALGELARIWLAILLHSPFLHGGTSASASPPNLHYTNRQPITK
jgi:hypothetical protein